MRGACRAAQRRFRERQKCLITDLKVRAETLQKENEAQRRRIAELEKENSVRRPAEPRAALRVRLEEPPTR